MLPALRRLYLYLVATAALLFTSYALEQFIQSLLYSSYASNGYTSFGGPSPRQALVLLLVALVIAVPVGGLHWWFIRREGKTDPTARGNGVRAFFLSALLIGYVSFAIGFAITFIDSLGQTPVSYQPYGEPSVPLPPYNATALATLIAALIGLAALLYERRWTRPDAETTAARNVTALLFVFAQFGWLLSALFNVSGFIQSVLDRVLQVYPACDYQYGPAPQIGQICQQVGGDLRYSAVTAVGQILGLLIFLWLPRRVRSNIVQQIGAGILAFTALIFAIVGASRLVSDFLVLVGGTAGGRYYGFGAGVVDVSFFDYNTPFRPATFPGPLLAGLLGMVGVWLWFTYRATSDREARGRAAMLVGLQLPLAFCFVYGLGGMIQFGLIALLGGPSQMNGTTLATFYSSVGLFVCDIAWPGLTYVLYRLSRGDESGARQAWRIYLVLLISLSVIAGLIGISVAAYEFFSGVTGGAPDNALQYGTQGFATALVALGVAAVHARLWRQDQREQRERPPQPAAQPATQPVAQAGTPTPAAPSAGTDETLEAVLARVASGALAPDAAAQQLRSRYHLD